MLALSSLSRSSRYVGILYAALLFFTQAMTVVLRGVTGHTGLAWVSLANCLEQLGNAIFRMPPRYDAPLALCLVMIAAVIIASVAILEQRVRGVEVIA